MNALNIARRHKYGLWADKSPPGNKGYGLPLSAHVDPACVMPLQSFSLPMNFGPWVNLGGAPRAALTVVCANSIDTERIARDGEWINKRAREFLNSKSI